MQDGLEFGTWSGMFEVKLDHSGGRGKDRPPWKYSESLQDIFRITCEQRMEMLPYIYSAANTSYKNGVLMKPLAYEYPDDNNTYEIWDEYIFGNAFLVAPVYDSTNNRSVYLPEGKWYDFNNLSNVYEGGRTINISVPLDKTPVFVKNNSVYVTGNIYQGNEKIWNKKLNSELTIHFFPGSAGDKTEYNYVDLNDSDKEKNISMESDKSKITLNAEPLKIDSKLLIKSGSEPASVTLNGKELKYNWNKNTGMIETNLIEGTKANIEITYK